MNLKPKEYAAFQDLIHHESGIKLEEGKEHLVQFRLGERMSQLGLSDYRNYLNLVQGPGGASELLNMLDAISTNVTCFFREPAHFDFVKTHVSQLRSKGEKHFKFWSAACSSGEEPYSLAMTLEECGLPADCDYSIYGSDLSRKVLDIARLGHYKADKKPCLPEGYIRKYCHDTQDSGIRIKEPLRAKTHFFRQNLISHPYDLPIGMNIIFLHNVLIYGLLSKKSR